MPSLFDKCSNVYPTWYNFLYASDSVECIQHKNNVYLYQGKSANNCFYIRSGNKVCEVFGLNRALYVFDQMSNGDNSYMLEQDKKTSEIKSLLMPITDKDRYLRWHKRETHLKEQGKYYHK